MTPAELADQQLADDELMRRIGNGDRQAFTSLVKRHLPRAIGTARRLLGSQFDAEEVAQEAFTRVWTHAADWQPSARGGAQFTTWLYRIVVNLCIDRRRRPGFESIDAIPEPIDSTPDATSNLQDEQVAAQVNAALAELPERQRAALTLCFYEGLSNGEAADILSLSVGAVESLLVRARRTLRERLQGTFKELVEG